MPVLYGIIITVIVSVLALLVLSIWGLPIVAVALIVLAVWAIGRARQRPESMTFDRRKPPDASDKRFTKPQGAPGTANSRTGQD